MTESRSKNDKAWEIIFEEKQILNIIAKQGFFEISSTRINQQREARLMTKFDHATQRPKIFKNNNLSIQPTSRGKYIIGAFESYYQIQQNTSTEVVYKSLPLNTDTITPNNIYSESSAILCAYLSGMIEEVIGDLSDEPVNFTVMGRMSTGKFDYNIENSKTKQHHAIVVTNSQCEIDGGFESENYFALIEAKSETVNDFIIRQLYYPYRLWKSKTDKEVIPIFLSISNDIFSFYRFRFTDDNLYNSLQLVSEHKYCISKSDVEISDIREILDIIEVIPDDDTPFPQADSFPRIIDLVGQLYATDDELSKDDITLMYAFDKRQTDYYVSAGIYLGLIERNRIAGQTTVYALSKHGLFVMSQHPQRRNIELVKCILKHRIFNEALKAWLEKAESLSDDEILSIMESGNEPIATGSLSTRNRRSRSVRGWIQWILKLATSL
jgi:hypothetical protein